MTDSIYEHDEKTSLPNDIFTTPPIIRRTVKVSEVKDDEPGNITIDPQSGTLIKTYYEYQNFTSYILKAFSNFTSKRIPQQMKRLVSLQDVGYLELYGAFFEGRPMVRDSKTGKPRKFLPLEARIDGKNYVGSIYTSARIIDPDGNEIANRPRIFAGNVPIMLGSNSCHLTNPTTGEIDEIKLVSQYGECNRDALGYFVIKGMEKILLLQERLRKNMIITIKRVKENKTIIVTKITCDTNAGSREIWIIEDDKALRVSLLSIFPQHMWDDEDVVKKKKKAGIPIFVLFRYILNNDMTEEEIFEKYFVPFIKKDKQKIWLSLYRSVVESKNQKDLDNYIDNEKTGKIRLRDEQVTGVGAERSRQIRAIVTRELFPHMTTDMIFTEANENEDTITTMNLTERKLYQFGIMIVKMSMYMIGSIEMDDWDNWGLKRVDSAAVIIEQLFTEIVDEYTRYIATSVKDKFMTDPEKILSCVEDSNNKITDLFIESFSTNKWGTSRKPKDNIVEQFKRETMLASYTQLTRISAPTMRKAKQASIRQIQMSQVGYVGVADSPEGPSCGLVKAIAITASLTISVESQSIISLLSSECRGPNELDDVKQARDDICMYNGIFMGWCNAKNVKSILIKLRRNTRIPKHTCVHINSIGALRIWTDGSRLVRPLLIVDNFDKLVIAGPLKDKHGRILKSDMWDEDMKTLLENGAVEYIDVLEQQTLVIAETIGDLMREKDEYKHSLQAATAAIDEEEDLLGLSGINKDDLRAALNDRRVSTRVKKKLLKIPTESSPELEAAIRKTTNALMYLNSKNNRRYTHCEYDPVAIFGIAAAMIPFVAHTQAPRNTYQCAMGKQSLGALYSSIDFRMENMKTLAFPSRPQITTTASELLGFGKDPSGENVIVALIAYEGYDQEDGMILNKQSIERGMFTTVIYNTYKSIRKKAVGSTVEMFFRHISGRKNKEDYHAIDSKGVPIIGTYVKEGHCIIGKIKKNKHNKTNSHIYDMSTYVKPGQQGMIDKVNISDHQDNTIITVRIRQVKIPEIGDKFASRYAQKSTLVKILDSWDMPYSITNKPVVKRFKEIGPFSLPEHDAETIHRLINIVDEDGKIALKSDKPGVVIREGSEFSEGDCLIAKGKDSIYAKFDGSVISVNEVTQLELIDYGVNVLRMVMSEDEIGKQLETIREKFEIERKLRGEVRLKVSYQIGNTTLIPDVIVSPLSIPSRMTIGKLIEILLSKVVSITGDRVYADSFRRINREQAHRILRDYGYDDLGWHQMVNGITGIVMNARIMTAPCYYQVLRHIVADKYQVRNRGSIRLSSRSPSAGRRFKGGQRFSSMTSNAMIGHGVPAVLHDRSCVSSDQQTTVVCKQCSILGTAVTMTEFATCSSCGGKEFVKLRTPFSWILFTHLLAGSNIKMKLTFKDVPN
uniref:DNA-directed RNA polymerase n=1 Tax=Pithovirus LCPAC401 TaxID=2506595 RepID=A0A481ZDI1_9VIRU|nr:MAG: DNA-directed RNA polymerase subunit beta [Pithovirus LCPAC401]